MSEGVQVSDLDIKAVARALGLTVRGDRFQVIWRGGQGLSGWLGPKGGWKDHATGDTGGVIELVRRVHGCDRAEARTWLEDNFGVAPLVKRTPEERRDYCRRLDAARWAAKTLVVMRDRGLEQIRQKDRQVMDEYDIAYRQAYEEQDIEILVTAIRLFQEHEELQQLRLLLETDDHHDLARVLAAAIKEGVIS